MIVQRLLIRKLHDKRKTDEIHRPSKNFALPIAYGCLADSDAIAKTRLNESVTIGAEKRTSIFLPDTFMETA